MKVNDKTTRKVVEQGGGRVAPEGEELNCSSGHSVRRGLEEWGTGRDTLTLIQHEEADGDRSSDPNETHR